MKQSTSIKILKKIEHINDIEKKAKLNESYEKELNLKKLKEEEEKNSILKIKKKWDSDEKGDLQKKINNIEINRKKLLNKIILKKDSIQNKIIQKSKSYIGIRTEDSEESGKEEQKEEINKNENFVIKNEKIINENKNIEIKIEENVDNLLEEKKSLQIKYNSIIEKSEDFLDDKINDLYEKFNYTMEVNRYIIEEMNYIKKNSPDNLVSSDTAVSNDDYIIQFLGYLGSELSLYRIKTLIEINPSNEIIRDITFKMILSNLALQRTYKIIIESEENKNNFKNDIQQWYDFNQEITKKLAKYYRINKDDIHFFNYDTINLEVMMIIYNKRLFGVENVLKSFDIKILTGNLLNNIILSTNMFSTKFCKNKNDWPNGKQYRGGEKYYIPHGWLGFAIKLRKKFGENFEWLGKEGQNEKEWCVAFHGVGRGNELIKVFSILNNNFRTGPKQRFYHQFNTRESSQEDYKYCGKGVYLTPQIKKAESYAKKVKLGDYSKNFKFIIQTRVNPKKIRDPGIVPINWILNGSNEEIRPYRLLVKMK